MNAKEIRNSFLEFFKSKQHQIVASAPMVIKNDPTLMFTNAGMNQFKDYFLGNAVPQYKRIADTQKCLRVSGKHNDLEEVGLDTYHHTMFEMLGNWSFGDYFKKEAIEWAWEYLTQVVGLNPEKLYATYFGGSEDDGLEADLEAFELWKKFLPEERILPGSKKDNFWEMGDTGPCGPCSEIHIDLREDDEIKKIPGRQLVNADNPEVIEIWNLVFIQFNRTADGSLKPLPDKHVDTGMGFERLCRAVQNKKSNYDTDVFQPIIAAIEKQTGLKYGNDNRQDIAMRVVADHLRAVSFAIADGQLPSNNKAGYVIRRILRRAVRYGYTFLDRKEPFIWQLTDVLAETMGYQFPELIAQKELISKVIKEEEQAFIKTLSSGIHRFENYLSSGKKEIDGAFAFELFDTYGFPIDLTQLMAREKGIAVDMQGFQSEMEKQKERSRNAAAVDTGDWNILSDEIAVEFVGYDALEAETEILRYRKVKTKGQEYFQVVLSKTPFYAEAGGQVGDKGKLVKDGKEYEVVNTIKENDLIIHLLNKLPEVLTGKCTAKVDAIKRSDTQRNHSATHLLHFALRSVLGTHVEQKGSLVDNERLRFDFSHFAKLSDDEIQRVEDKVNELIEKDLLLSEHRSIEMEKAAEMGAMALFGEKYGDKVRVIQFGESVELCGGTHVKHTGDIKCFKIVSESAIAAGVRRIEALSGNGLLNYYREKERLLEKIAETLKKPKDILKSIQNLLEQNETLSKQLDEVKKQKAKEIKEKLLQSSTAKNGCTFIIQRTDIDAAIMKDIAFQLKGELSQYFIFLAGCSEGKVSLLAMLSEQIIKEKSWNAAQIIKEVSKEINGGGGGQPHFATAGGTNCDAIDNVLKRVKNLTEI